MPLGSAVKSTINIDFTRAQGTNSSGKILFQPPRVVVGTTMLSTRAVAADVADGVGTIELVRLPAGTYHVTEIIDNQEPYEWDFSLPLAAPSTIEYETIAAVSPVPTIYTAVRTVNGVAPDPVTGNVTVVSGGASDLDALDDVVIAAPTNGQVITYDDADDRWENKTLVAGDIGAAAAVHSHSVANVTGLQGMLDGKAALEHDHLAADITDFQTTVDARVQLIVDAAPAALDTLNELASALNDDPNYAATVTTLLAGKAPLVHGHAIADITGLQASIDGKLSRARLVSRATTGSLKTAWPGLCGNGAAPWTVCPAAYRVAVAAQAGDILTLNVGLILGTPTATGDAEFDVVSLDNTNTVTPTKLRYLSTFSAVQDPLGHGSLYTWSGNGRRFGVVPDWVVTSDDIVGGTVTLAVMYKNAGSGLSAGAASYSSTISLVNHGAA